MYLPKDVGAGKRGNGRGFSLANQRTVPLLRPGVPRAGDPTGAYAHVGVEARQGARRRAPLAPLMYHHRFGLGCFNVL
jgi:hypothetical protein